MLNGHSKRVNSLVFARGGKILASGGDDGLVKLWDVSSAEPREMTALTVGFIIYLRGVFPRWENFGRFRFSARRSSAGIYRTLKSPVEMPPLEGKDGHSSWVLAIAFSPRTNLLISAGTGGDLIAWDSATDPKGFSPRKLALPHGSIGIVNAAGRSLPMAKQCCQPEVIITLLYGIFPAGGSLSSSRATCGEFFLSMCPRMAGRSLPEETTGRSSCGISPPAGARSRRCRMASGCLPWLFHQTQNSSLLFRQTTEIVGCGY